MDIVTQPEVYEAVEYWSFVFVGGTAWTTTVHLETGESVIRLADRLIISSRNPDDEKLNEEMVVLLRNLLYFGHKVDKQQVYPKGESPVEQHLKAQAEKLEMTKRARAARLREIDALYVKETDRNA